jgi:hypothetical protein
VQLALATGIPFAVWECEDDATVATALELLDERNAGEDD